MDKIKIYYFTDILCIWAYIAQVRINELLQTFPDDVEIQYHFCQVFGDVEGKMEKSWNHKGGIKAYQEHVLQVASRYEHITVNPDIWASNTPSSSMSCHLFLHAAGKLVNDNDNIPESLFAKLVWEMREAFFVRGEDVSCLNIQMALADKLGFPTSQIERHIKSGLAFAALQNDFDLAKEYDVTMSPTLVFNEGRQRLLGNVGYRVIEANVRELLHRPPEEFSWC